MIFRRKNVEAAELIVAPAVVKIVAPDDTALPLVDVVGTGFELLRPMDLGHSLWRITDHTELDALPTGQIVLLAAYTPEDITRARPLMGRFMTIVIGMGLGPHYGSRSLQLGAVGYLDSTCDEGSIRGLFSDAVARVRIRRLRAGSGSSLN